MIIKMSLYYLYFTFEIVEDNLMFYFVSEMITIQKLGHLPHKPLVL